ncbi:hypothetical protein [Desulfofalx alkaliphila]|uniref:hypothetical protein n=1 Tax=Desulfofalx alkaliphila TaxID=105483 RepID=UPI0004E10A7B|nr:hypothetical protein [Desulfofalx alkaliphila]
MKTRKRKKSSLGLRVILIGSLALVNFTGITYASWNNGLNHNYTVATGYIDPKFSQHYELNHCGDYEYLNVNIKDEKIIISGKVYPNYSATINYGIKNEGTLPVILDGESLVLKNGDAINLEIDNSHSKVITSEEPLTINNQISIEAKEEGGFQSEIKLPYTQWNK